MSVWNPMLLLLTTITFVATCVVGTARDVPLRAPAQYSGAHSAAEQENDNALQESETPAAPEPAVSPQIDANQDAKSIRFVLWDGSIAIGELEKPILHMQTDFGLLEIPVEKIVEFRPGLQSYPQVKERIDKLVEQLGDREFEVREQAHRELAAMGLMIIKLLPTYSDGGSAERKKHLAELNEEIEQLIEEAEEFGMDTPQQPLISLDAINTGEFTVLGTVQEKEFTVHTRYGTVKIGLHDVRMADRRWASQTTAMRKVVNIKGNQFMQKVPVSTGIRVQRGDKVVVRADGAVRWANWGNITSTPDGISNQGQWNGHQSGRLIGRIGKNGPFIDIGSRSEFVAKSSGMLYLGIAIQDAYAQNEGYQFPGQYRARITVHPAR